MYRVHVGTREGLVTWWCGGSGVPYLSENLCVSPTFSRILHFVVNAYTAYVA